MSLSLGLSAFSDLGDESFTAFWSRGLCLRPVRGSTAANFVGGPVDEIDEDDDDELPLRERLSRALFALRAILDVLVLDPSSAEDDIDDDDEPPPAFPGEGCVPLGVFFMEELEDFGVFGSTGFGDFVIGRTGVAFGLQELNSICIFKCSAFEK